MPNLREATFVPSGRPESTFAARALDVSGQIDAEYARQSIAWSRTNSARAWKWYDEIGIVHQAIDRTARVAGFARLYARKKVGPGRYEVVENGAVATAVEQIYAQNGGVRGLVERFYTLMKVPCEGFLVREPSGDGYFFLSSDEADVTKDAAGEITEIRWRTAPRTAGGDGQAAFERILKPSDLLGRVWTPSKRYFDLVDSTLASLDLECEILSILTRLIKGRLRSRFAMNGIFYVPLEINDVEVANIANDGTTRDPILKYLAKAMLRNVQNYDQAEAAVPIFMRGPGEASAALDLKTFDQSINEIDMKIRGEIAERIFDSLDIGKKTVKGAGEANHWGDWAAADEERRVAATPVLEMMCWAFTRLVLYPALQQSNMDAADILAHDVWFDLSAASVKTNAAEDTRLAADHLAANAEAIRRTAGLSDDDALKDDELIRAIGLKMQDPYLATFGLPEQADFDWDKIKTTKPGPAPSSNGGEEPSSGPGVGDPGSPNDRKSDTPRRKEPG